MTVSYCFMGKRTCGCKQVTVFEIRLLETISKKDRNVSMCKVGNEVLNLLMELSPPQFEIFRISKSGDFASCGFMRSTPTKLTSLNSAFRDEFREVNIAFFTVQNL